MQARFPLRTRSHGSVWWNPIPLAGALYRIVAQGPQRGVAVGELGMVLTLNEQGLSGSAVNVSSSLRAVLPLGLGDSEQRWLAGDGGTLLLQRGGSVVDHSVATCAMGCDLLALSGDNSQDLWAAGAQLGNGVLLHFNGSRFVPVPLATPPLRALWQRGGRGFAVGDRGALVRLQDGVASMDPQSGSLSTANLRSLWGSGAQKLYAGGDNGALLSFDGERWQTEASGVSGTIDALSAVGPDGERLLLATASGLWAWERGQKSPTLALAEKPILDVSAQGEDVLALGADAQVFQGRFDPAAGALSFALQKSGKARNLYVLWASAANDLWTVGDAGTILRSRGDGRDFTDESSGTLQTLNAIHGSVPDNGSVSDNVWAVGEKGTILRFDGQRWISVDSGTTETLYGVFVSPSGTRVTVLGSQGRLIRIDGKTRSTSEIVVPDRKIKRDFYALWGPDEERLFAVGQFDDMADVRPPRPTIMYYDGRTWTRQDAPAQNASLIWVRGRSSDDVWAVGVGGLTLHFDGRAWSPVDVPSERRVTLRGVCSLSDGRALAVGDRGTLLLYRPGQSAWEALDSGVSMTLRDVYATQDHLWLVGDRGVILRRDLKSLQTAFNAGRESSQAASTRSAVLTR